jgi:hypothetical protein
MTSLEISLFYTCIMYNNPCLNMNEIFLIVERIIYLAASLLNDHWPLVVNRQMYIASSWRSLDLSSNVHWAIWCVW